MPRCSKGHESTEPDFCSECGARIEGPAAVADPTPVESCPACGVARLSTESNFCELCGYNFATKTPGGVPVPAPAPPSTEPPVTGWMTVVSIDPSLRETDSPEPPPNTGPFTIKLDQPVNLIGRKSESRAIFPEIPLNFDDAVSHRHAVLTRGADGTLVLRDIGSSNGTRLNGQDVPPMTDQPLKDGDQLTLGHWTRIEIRAVR